MMICFICILIFFIFFPRFIKQSYLYTLIIFFLAMISSISFYNINFNCNVFLNNTPSYYQNIEKKQISYLSHILYIKFLVPTFLINKKVYTTDMIEIKLDDYRQYDLIEISGSSDMDIIMFFLKNITHMEYIKKIIIIDNRRCRVLLQKNNKSILVDFPAGKPNIKKFFKTDHIYDLTNKFNYIDFRYNHFIIGKNTKK